MSLLNKYMHPRNIYRIAPDFKELAILYPEFRAFTKQEISGKVIIDFKDPATLRALAATLLKKDFGLSVNIPVDRLVPTIPLRLNYLLWIEDLLLPLKEKRLTPVIGIDIGTGATCIYPLLAAKTNNWQMVATDVDDKNIKSASGNIIKNQLQNLITVKHVDVKSLLLDVVDGTTTYDFCMCNPPFFSNEQELDPANKSRSGTRPAPHNGRTGTLGEVVVEGGEVAFIQKMINESKELGTKIRIYTTMVGVKSSLVPLKSELSKLEISNVAQTEFCQGHTTRWGLAWSFDNSLQLTAMESKKSKRKRDQKKPLFKYVLPKSCSLPEYTIAAATTKLLGLLEELKMACVEVKNDKHMTSHCVSAYENTWSNQRRKRRQATKDEIRPAETKGEVSKGGKRLIEESNDEEVSNKKYKSSDMVVIEEKSAENLEGSTAALDAPILKASLVVKKVSGEINVELSWIDGLCGKDAVHQVLQYFKNNIK